MSPLILAALAGMSAIAYCCDPAPPPDDPVVQTIQLRRSGYGINPDEVFYVLNRQYRVLRVMYAAVTWRELTGEEINNVEAQRLEEDRASGCYYRRFPSRWCGILVSKTVNFKQFTASQKRQFYLLCRTPTFTVRQTKEVRAVRVQLKDVYVKTQVCRGVGPCYFIEPDLHILMKTSRDPAELLWAWHQWRAAIGPPTRQLYPALISTLNEGALSKGYPDTGAYWRAELETEDLEGVVEELFLQVKPLWQKLHAYVRYHLSVVYKFDPTKLIPAHLLGNMWAQNWESVLPLVSPTSLDLESAFLSMNYTVNDLARLAEDFYHSLGLQALPRDFWRKSQLTKRPDRPGATCHGTAVNMYNGDDFRIVMCAKVSLEDFYVLTHELGHVHYYMAYKDLPTIFQDGANSAFHEAVGDAVMYGVLNPQHLQRLGILDPSIPQEDISLLLRMALNKIPQLAFGLIMDKWRWGVMKGIIPPEKYNSAWWDLHAKYLGVCPPTTRTEEHFDAAAKSHIVENTPYIRYFLAGFLQLQLLDVMCEATARGKQENTSLPLHRCDIYNSSHAGDKLKQLMEMGSSEHWSKALHVMSEGKYDFYSSKPLRDFYRPLSDWLDAEINRHNMPVWTF